MDPYRAQTNPGGSTALSGARPNDAVAEGIQQLGGAMRRIGEREKARDRDMQNAAAGLEFATISSELDKAEIDARDNAAPGAAGHTESIDKLADERINKALGNIRDERLRAAYQTRYADLRGTVSNRAYGWERAAHTELMVSNVGETKRILANGQQNNPDPVGYEVSRDTLKTMWEHLDVAPAIKEKGLREDLRDLALAAGQAWADKEPKAFLYEKDGKTDGGILKRLSPDLTADDIDKLRTRGQAELARLEAKASKAAAVWESRRRDEIQAVGKRITDFGDFDTITEKDWDLIAEDVKKFNDGAGDKTLELDVGKWRDLALLGKSTKDWTPADWKKNVEELEAKPKLSTEEAMRLDNLRTLRGPAEAKFNAAPDAWSNQNGDPMPAVDWGNPSRADGDARTRWAERIMRQGGKPFVLNTDELTRFKQRAGEGIAGQIEIAQTLRSKFGVGRGAQLAIQQIGGNTANLTLMLGLPAHTAKDYRVGIEALNRNPKLNNRAIANEVRADYGSAYPQEMSGVIDDAARAIAAAELEHAGNVDPDDDDYKEAYRKALHRAVGGTGSGAAGGAGGFIRWGNAPLIIPPEMPKDEALRRLSRATAEQVMKANTNATGDGPGGQPYYVGPNGKPAPYGVRADQILKQGTLEGTGTPGVYRVRLEDGGHVVNKNGQFWQFDIRKLK